MYNRSTHHSLLGVVIMASRTGIVATVGIIAMFVFSTSVTGLTDDQIALMKSLRDSCVAESGVDESKIIKTASGEFPDDRPLKCYIKCVYEQIAVLVDDAIDGEAMIAMMPEEIAHESEPTVRKCMTAKGADGCEVAFNFQKCIYEDNPEKYMII